MHARHGLHPLFWKRRWIAKEDCSMTEKTIIIGDVDDLIFQDAWITSDR